MEDDRVDAGPEIKPRRVMMIEPRTRTVSHAAGILLAMATGHIPHHRPVNPLLRRVEGGEYENRGPSVQQLPRHQGERERQRRLKQLARQAK